MGRLGVGFLHLSVVPTEGRGGCWIPQNWNYGDCVPPDLGAGHWTPVFSTSSGGFSRWATIPLFVDAFELGLCLCKSHYSLVSMAIIFFSWCNIPIFALTFLVCCLSLNFLPDTQFLLCFFFLPSFSPSLPLPYLPPALLSFLSLLLLLLLFWYWAPVFAGTLPLKYASVLLPFCVSYVEIGVHKATQADLELATLLLQPLSIWDHRPAGLGGLFSVAHFP